MSKLFPELNADKLGFFMSEVWAERIMPAINQSMILIESKAKIEVSGFLGLLSVQERQQSQ